FVGLFELAVLVGQLALGAFSLGDVVGDSGSDLPAGVGDDGGAGLDLDVRSVLAAIRSLAVQRDRRVAQASQPRVDVFRRVVHELVNRPRQQFAALVAQQPL